MNFDEIFMICPKWDKEQVIRFSEQSGSLSGSMKNKMGVIRITTGKDMKLRGKKAISVLMVGFQRN